MWVETYKKFKVKTLTNIWGKNSKICKGKILVGRRILMKRLSELLQFNFKRNN